MNYSELIEQPKRFLALTSLEVEEFTFLLPTFSKHWSKYYKYHTLEGKPRKHPLCKEHGNALLKGDAQKLFFLLVFLKTNPLQEYQGASFGISQSKVSHILKVLLPILNEALHELGLSPVRLGTDLGKHLADHPDKVFYYDGMDRDQERSTDVLVQEEGYSGKHKKHTVKNLSLCDQDQYIHYLSPTETGCTHDKTITDEYPITLPEGSVLKQDLGFLGHVIEGVEIEQPYKKPKNQELKFFQKLYNKLLASTRIVIEHANSGVKRLRIVKDKIRLHGMETKDQVVMIACQLHNLRVKSSYRAYTQARI